MFRDNPKRFDDLEKLSKAFLKALLEGDTSIDGIIKALAKDNAAAHKATQELVTEHGNAIGKKIDNAQSSIEDMGQHVQAIETATDVLKITMATGHAGTIAKIAILETAVSLGNSQIEERIQMYQDATIDAIAKHASMVLASIRDQGSTISTDSPASVRDERSTTHDEVTIIRQEAESLNAQIRRQESIIARYAKNASETKRLHVTSDHVNEATLVWYGQNRAYAAILVSELYVNWLKCFC